MENTPLPSIKVSDQLFKKLQIACEIAKQHGMSVADVRRTALNLGLDVLERMGYDVDAFLSASAARLAEEVAAQPPPVDLRPLRNKRLTVGPKRGSVSRG